MPGPKHPIWFIIGIAVVGVLGLSYSHLMYQNGADPLKDGGLIALVGGVVALWAKISSGIGGGSEDKPE